MPTTDSFRFQDFLQWPGEQVLSLDVLGWFLVPIATALLIWMGWRLLNAARLRRCPGDLFRQLSRTAGLSRSQRRTIRRIAIAESLASPISLMLAPSTLDHHVNRFLRRVRRPAARQRITEAAQAIHETIFDSPVAAPIKSR